MFKSIFIDNFIIAFILPALIMKDSINILFNLSSDKDNNSKLEKLLDEDSTSTS